MKEITKDRAKTYHICDPYDVEQIKTFDIDQQRYAVAGAHHPFKSMSTDTLKSDNTED